MAPSLLALSRAEEQEAKRQLGLKLRLQIAVLVIVLIAQFVKAPAAYFLAVVVVAGEGAAWWIGQLARERQGVAEEGLRRAALTRLLGSHHEPQDIADVTMRFSDRARATADEWEDETYWGTTGPAGPGALRAGMQEAAFYSAHLYRAAARRAWAVCIAFFAFVLVAAVALLIADLDEVGVIAARVIALALSFVIATDQLGAALAWGSAASASERVDRRLEHADLTHLDVAMAVHADYAVARAGARPIPQDLYDRLKDQLADAWTKRQAGETAAAA